MSVLVDEGTRLCVAGITGREGTFHTLNNRNYGTNVVGGVTPGKGGQDVEGIPVFDSWADAMAQAQPNTAMIFVPPRFAADSRSSKLPPRASTWSSRSPRAFPRTTSCASTTRSSAITRRRG
jgi:succinyl-CoA synthetase alpha subunit